MYLIDFILSSSLFQITKVLFSTHNLVEVTESANEVFASRCLYQCKQINDMWSSLQIEKTTSTISWYVLPLDWFDISHSAPILAFKNNIFNLHYRLIHNGEVISALGEGLSSLNSRNLADELLFYKLESENPTFTPRQIRNLIYSHPNIEDIYHQIREAPEYRRRVEEMYANHTPEAFSILHLDTIKIQRMSESINSEVHLNNSIPVDIQTNIFKELLELDGILEEI